MLHMRVAESRPAPAWRRLTAESVAPYLLDHELVTRRQLVDDGLAVAEFSRRNRSFRAANERGVSYLLKQGVGSERALTVANEASAYAFLHARFGARDAGAFFPRRHAYDADNNVLVMEFLRGAENLREYHTRTHRFPTGVAAQLGRAVARVHALVPDWLTKPSDPPWALSALQLPAVGFLREVSGSNLQLVKIIQEFPEYGRLLETLRAGWAPQCLIHGDLKWENCVVFARGAKTRKLKLVDWELATIGDPGWDVGSIFADYLSYWVFSMPISGDADPGDFVKLAQWPLTRMQPAIDAFWQAYANGLGLDRAARQERLWRSVSYAGGRLVQTAFEHLQNSNFLTGPAVCLLQLSFNMMRRPSEAAVQLLGIPSEESWNTTLSF